MQAAHTDTLTDAECLTVQNGFEQFKREGGGWCSLDAEIYDAGATADPPHGRDMAVQVRDFHDQHTAFIWRNSGQLEVAFNTPARNIRHPVDNIETALSVVKDFWQGRLYADHHSA